MKWPDTHTARITLAAAVFAAAVGTYALCTSVFNWPAVHVAQAAMIVLILLAATGLCLTVYEAAEDRTHTDNPEPAPEPEPVGEDT
ncbi:hypothetical protein ACWD2L_00345 [Streptomyces sp. NPDC002754]